ncbi:hypothetical protein RchiOBHm_Chr6g0294771 [Rosa chinensis]|uniref:Uncharacterized protein n=1 Tax=Rosa chinensis TaxID=74649 RepID=A0A2P6PWZ4_ROSCH|nr:hypothetical protein RchiOBHm_Chr6g0294771 [Rosa chinensis]
MQTHCFHLFFFFWFQLTSIKRWFLQAPGENESSLDKLPHLPDRKPDDLRRYYPVDKEALDRAWDQLAGVGVDKRFIWETVRVDFISCFAQIFN